MRRLVALVSLAVSATVVAGCNSSGGPDLVRGKGKVLYKGKPVAEAMVTFMPEKAGLPATGTTDQGGVFTLSTQGRSGAKKGNYLVTVAKSAAGNAPKEMKPEDMMRMGKAAMKKGLKGYAGREEQKSEIPTKYAKGSTSKLAATVSADASKNDFEFLLAD